MNNLDDIKTRLAGIRDRIMFADMHPDVVHQPKIKNENWLLDIAEAAVKFVEESKISPENKWQYAAEQIIQGKGPDE